jgi:hypothetical protein
VNHAFNFMPHVGPELRAALLAAAEARDEWAYIWLDHEGGVHVTWERPHGPEVQGYYAEFAGPEIYGQSDEVLKERITRMGHLDAASETPEGISTDLWENVWA